MIDKLPSAQLYLHSVREQVQQYIEII